MSRALLATALLALSALPASAQEKSTERLLTLNLSAFDASRISSACGYGYLGVGLQARTPGKYFAGGAIEGIVSPGGGDVECIPARPPETEGQIVYSDGLLDLEQGGFRVGAFAGAAPIIKPVSLELVLGAGFLNAQSSTGDLHPWYSGGARVGFRRLVLGYEHGRLRNRIRDEFHPRPADPDAYPIPGEQPFTERRRTRWGKFSAVSVGIRF